LWEKKYEPAKKPKKVKTPTPQNPIFDRNQRKNKENKENEIL